MSTLFLRTLREDPADADVASHRLLVRAGYIRRAAPGGFTWLPLGWIVYQNVERVVREEMNHAGFQEVHFPALLPREPYELSGRWTDYGDNVFRLKDRKGADMLLAPTHEEMFTLLVKDLYSSYKDLPLVIYQIQTKFRDEARPRAGLLRGREFVMKDSYSFDLTDEGLDDQLPTTPSRLPAHVRPARPAIRDRVGDEWCDGRIGQRGVPRTDGRRRGLIRSLHQLRLRSQHRGGSCGDTGPIPYDNAPPALVADTPDTPTIQTLVDLINSRDDLRRPDRDWTAADTLKNVIVKLRHPDGRIEPLAVGVPGDREVDLKRLEAQLHPVEVGPFGEEDFAANKYLVKGYIGPGALGADKPAGIRYLIDPRIVDGTQWVTGADQPGRHVLYLTAGRDFVADGTVEAAEVTDGDACPVCGSALEMARGIEIGHIFQLGRKFAKALGLNVLGSERQAAGRHDGFVRHRCLTRRCRDRRDEQRRQGTHLAT